MDSLSEFLDVIFKYLPGDFLSQIVYELNIRMEDVKNKTKDTKFEGKPFEPTGFFSIDPKKALEAKKYEIDKMVRPANRKGKNK